MSIARPVTKTVISSPSWGIPITDEVNRLTDTTGRYGGQWRTASAQSVPNNTLTTVNWTAEMFDTPGIATPPFTTLTIPSGGAGVWAFHASLYLGGPQGVINLNISNMSGIVGVSAPCNAVSGWATCSVACWVVAVGTTISVACYQGTGAALGVSGAFAAYRISD